MEGGYGENNKGQGSYGKSGVHIAMDEAVVIDGGSAMNRDKDVSGGHITMNEAGTKHELLGFNLMNKIYYLLIKIQKLT